MLLFVYRFQANTFLYMKMETSYALENIIFIFCLLFYLQFPQSDFYALAI